MKIVIIADAHNNLVRLQRVLDYCQKEKVDGLISCGDLASMETLDFLIENFSGPIWHVLGNMDKDFLQKKITEITQRENATIFPDFGELVLQGNKLAFVHFPQKAQELFASKKYAVVFYGHTHQPWLEKSEGRYLINQGNVTGDRCPATFAVWEVEKNHFQLLPADDLKKD